MAHRAANILIVGDETETLETCQRILANAGFAAAPATSRVMLDVDLAAFGVVLIDLEAAGRKGLALLDEIRERQPRIEVIGITADQSLEDAKTAVRYGASDFVVKPLEPATVTTVVTQALERNEWALQLAQPESGEEGGSRFWIEYEGDGQITIGVERRFLKSIGTPIYIELPVDEQEISRGETLFRVLTHEGRIHAVASPVSGRVLRVNEALLGDVDEIRQAGWAVRMGMERSEDHGNQA